MSDEGRQRANALKLARSLAAKLADRVNRVVAGLATDSADPRDLVQPVVRDAAGHWCVHERADDVREAVGSGYAFIETRLFGWSR